MYLATLVWPTSIPILSSSPWDPMLLIYGVVPKKFFKQNPAYWGAK
jgi:hypothetical protein